MTLAPQSPVLHAQTSQVRTFLHTPGYSSISSQKLFFRQLWGNASER